MRQMVKVLQTVMFASYIIMNFSKSGISWEDLKLNVEKVGEKVIESLFGLLLKRFRSSILT